jgi:hypothetical protein
VGPHRCLNTSIRRIAVNLDSDVCVGSRYENKLHFALTSGAKARHSVVMNYTNIRNITTTTITTTPTG